MQYKDLFEKAVKLLVCYSLKYENEYHKVDEWLELINQVDKKEITKYEKELKNGIEFEDNK